MRLSFRTRLIIAFVALFAAISVVVSFAGLMLREQKIRSLFDSELQTRGQDISDNLNKLTDFSPESVQAKLDEITRQIYFKDFYVQIYNDRSEPLAKSQSLGRGQLMMARPFEDTSKDNQVVERPMDKRTFPDGGPPSLRGQRLRFFRDGHSYIAIVAQNPQVVNESVNEARTLFLGGNLAGFFAAAGAAWLVTGAMARRLNVIKTQVQTLGPDDISRRIVMEDNDEISELATHLNQMLDRLKAGFESQERFIHDASHELKTPVATVQAEAQALLLGKPQTVELLDFVHSTNEEMRRLGRLTEALLLLTRANDTFSLSRFRIMDLTELAITSIRHLSTMATDHQIRLNLASVEHDEGIFVRCDPDLVETLIGNLIRNGIRFSPRGSDVRIRVSGTGGIAKITVEDDGPAIPADVLSHIFDRYFQSSPLKVRRGGGIGLAIAARVANLHDGAVSAMNLEPVGASFSATFPLVKHQPVVA